MSEDKPELAIGIDLGTTNSCVAVFINDHVEIITNESGNRTTPSYVAFTEEGQRHIGDAAKNQLVKNVKNTVYGSKRLIGRKFTDPLVQAEIKTFPFKVIEKNSRPSIEIKSKRKGYRYFTVEDIAAMILKRMVKMSQQFLNQKIKNVVITVPAYFNDAQRQATKNAGIVAGLKVLRIINEPTAAAIAYGQKYGIDNKTIAVYDLGGGTLDVSIVKVQNGSYSVLATCGDPHLGGEDFDQNVIEHFIKLYHMKTKKDVSKDNRAIQRLRNEVEKAKKQLTFATSANLEIESFFDNDDFSETLTRAKFEELNKDKFKSTLTPLQDALEQAKLKKSDIDEIIMVGGSSRIPKVRQLVQEFFDGKEPFQKINPDEAIAYGAAIQASVLTGQSNSINLTDVNPLSLGMELNTKKMKVFIPRNTPIPTKATHTLTTSLDFQKEIMFPLYEGELPIAADNLFLGKFTLTNIQRAAKGVPRIKTTFEIDADGILQVSAEDLVTKKKQDINVEYEKNRPSPEEIEEMIKISLEYEKLDEKYNESVNARIKLSETVFMYKSSLAKKTLRKHQMDKLDKVVDDVIQWMNELKICSIEEYNEKLEKFEKNVKSIENEN